MQILKYFSENCWKISIDNKVVFSTTDKRDLDLFYAELLIKTVNGKEALKNDFSEQLAQLNELVKLSESDPEVAHVKADRILLGVIESLGLNNIVEAYNKIERWYS